MAIFLSRLAFAFAALLIASVVFIGALGFVCYAVFLYLATLMPEWLAAIATALVLVIFAMVVLLIGRSFASAGVRAGTSALPFSKSRESLEALLGLDLAALAARSPFATTGVAFLLGLLFGFSPRLRQAAADLLKR
jgi:hypothetical protein